MLKIYISILKIKVGIQAIKTTETRGMIALQHSSVRKSLLWHFIRYYAQCQIRAFLTELCYYNNTIIPLVSVLFIAWISTLIFKINNFLMY